jgi:hypothetical protein
MHSPPPHILGIIAAIALAAGAAAHAPPTTRPARHDRFPLEPAYEVLTQAAASPDWIFRAIAAMRLEGMVEAEADEYLERLRGDTDGRVRAFAVRSMSRRPDGTRRLAGMTDPDPRVLRVAMLYGAAPDEAAVRTAASRALRTKSMPLRLLGIELAAMLGDTALNRQALRALDQIITNMNRMQAAYLSHRLGPACGLGPAATIADWQRWLATGRAGGDATIQPAATSPVPTPPGAPPDGAAAPTMGIDDLEAEMFVRFVTDYLTELKSRRLELVVCVDTSGSMRPTIAAAQAGVEQLFGFLAGVTEEPRVGIVGYSDVENPLVGVPLTTNVGQVRATLWSLTIGGGTEPVTDALRAAISDNRWSEGAMRVVVLVGDEPYQPHNGDALRELLWNAGETGFSVNTVKVAGARGRDPTFLPEWDQIATWGGGRSAFLVDAEDLVKLIVSLCVGRGWEDEIEDLMGAYFECLP